MFIHTCINGILRRKGTTPTALKRLFRNMNYAILRLNLQQIAPKRHNAYSVDSHII